VVTSSLGIVAWAAAAANGHRDRASSIGTLGQRGRQVLRGAFVLVLAGVLVSLRFRLRRGGVRRSDVS
jgi:hypothetical protein